MKHRSVYLYQRLLVADVGTIDIQTFFQYEFCSYPASLFDKNILMRIADITDMQHDFVKRVPSCIITECPDGVKFVIAWRFHAPTSPLAKIKHIL